jgi:hypothetical protein
MDQRCIAWSACKEGVPTLHIPSLVVLGAALYEAHKLLEGNIAALIWIEYTHHPKELLAGEVHMEYIR